jgi:transposase
MTKNDIPTELPNDLEICHELIRKLAADNERLGRRLEELIRSRYGRSSEKMTIGQLSLFAQEIMNEFKEETVAATIKSLAKNGRHGGGGRSLQSTNLPVERKEYTVPQEELPCPTCKQERVPIGHESSEELEFVPASFRVIKHVQVKYGCRQCQEQIILATRTDIQPIEKGMPGFGLLAQIIVSKYLDHLPLYRQEQIYWRQGADIARSSMCRWQRVCAERLKPLLDLMKEEVLKSKVINADETPVRFLKPGAGKAPRGYVWTYVGDNEHPYVLFEFHPDQSAERPKQFLGEYAGYLQTDAYTGYNGLHLLGKVKAVACFAHARRYFEKALGSEKLLAEEGLARIAILYDIERRIKELDDTERSAIRLLEAVPRLEELRAWLETVKQRTLPKSAIGEAISYTLNNWTKLYRYTEQPFLSIDNNLAENSLRPIALGRKNWLFIGSEDSGEVFSVLGSLANSCKRLGVEPFSYFRDVLQRISARSYTDLRELLPINFVSTGLLTAA